MSLVKDVEKKIAAAIDEYTLISPGDNILSALSGGKDSVCLTHFLVNNSGKYGIKVSACHLNHMIRGAEADRDEAFSAKLCVDLGIPFFSEKRNVPEKAERESKSVEEAARDERYAFFLELAERHGFGKIATAHTLSDQCETIIFNFIRGRGLSGMAGIPPARRSGDLTIIRPLIGVTSEEVELYLSSYGLSHVTDSTNDDTDYSRNLIRREIVPLMKRINPSLPSAAEYISADAREYERMIGKLRRDIEKKYAMDEDGAIPYAAAEELLGTPGGGEILYSLFCARLPEGTDFRLSRERFCAIADFIKKRAEKTADVPGRRIQVGGGVEAVFSKDGFSFAKSESTENRGVKRTLLPGKNDFPDVPGTFLIEKREKGEAPKNINKKCMTMFIASDMICGELFARRRLPGDSIVYGGMSHSAKKIISEAGIPQERRKSLPVVCDEKGPLWIPGGTVADRVSATLNRAGDVIMISYMTDKEKSATEKGR